mmetsp:Transcript_27039/g.68134  ORF Transcript_27039/g.68134 Transcript_27039/m.68134 type:complete len:261 (-) Transcript_27039:532-1314(-)
MLVNSAPQVPALRNAGLRNFIRLKFRAAAAAVDPGHVFGIGMCVDRPRLRPAQVHVGRPRKIMFVGPCGVAVLFYTWGLMVVAVGDALLRRTPIEEVADDCTHPAPVAADVGGPRCVQVHPLTVITLVGQFSVSLADVVSFDKLFQLGNALHLELIQNLPSLRGVPARVSVPFSVVEIIVVEPRVVPEEFVLAVSCVLVPQERLPHLVGEQIPLPALLLRLGGPCSVLLCILLVVQGAQLSFALIFHAVPFQPDFALWVF